MSFTTPVSEPYVSRMQDQSFFSNDMYPHGLDTSSASHSPTTSSPNSPYPQYLAPQHQQHLTSRETGIPLSGKYAQDGFWDDESDSNTVRQRASTSTAHTVMTSSHKSATPKSVATAKSSMGDKSPAPTLDQQMDERPGMFGWAKRPSVANLQAAIGHSPSHEDREREKQGLIQKKKSFGKLMGKGKRGELVIHPDPADESFEAGPLPPTPSTCKTDRSRTSTSPKTSTRMRQPLAQSTRVDLVNPPPVTAAATAVPDVQGKTKPSGWKASMSRLFKSKSSHTLRETKAAAPVPDMPARSDPSPADQQQQRQQQQQGDVPPVPTLPLNIKKRNAHAQSSMAPGNPTPPPSSTRPDFGPPHLPSMVRNESSSSKHTTSVYGLFTSPPPSARSTSFPLPLESHPSLPADPFASTLDASSNYLPSPSLTAASGSGSRTASTFIVDHQPFASTQQQAQSQTLPSRPKLPRHSPSLRDLVNLFPGGSRKVSKTKSLANLRLDKDDSPGPELPTKESAAATATAAAAYQTLAPSPELAGPFLPEATPAPIESPPLLPPKPPYFPPTSRPNSSAQAEYNIGVSGPGSPLTPPPTSPLPPTPTSGGSQSSPPQYSQTPLAGPLHTVPLSGGPEKTLKRSGSTPVLLPRSRSTSMSLKAPPTSSSFFDLYEQLGIWPTPEKAAQEKGKDKEEPTSPLEPKRNLTNSISDLASKLASSSSEPAAADTTASGQISTSASATFSAASWQAAIDAFPLIDAASSTEAVADMSMDFGLPYARPESSHMTAEPDHLSNDGHEDLVMPGDAVEGRRERAEAAEYSRAASSSSQARPASQSTARASTSASVGQSQGYSKGLGFSELRPTARQSTGSRDRSRDSSRSRRSRPRTEGGWYDGASASSSSKESSDDDEDDNVPLSVLHPQAQEKRKQAEAAKALRRAQRLAARQAAMRQLAPTGQTRDPGGQYRWNGEGGVPADILAHKLHSVLQVRTDPIPQQAQLPSGYGSSSRSNKYRPAPIDTRGLRPQRSLTGPGQHPELGQHHMASVPVQRSSTTRDPTSHQRQQPPRSPSLVPPMPSRSLQSSPMLHPGMGLVPSPTIPYHSHSSSSRGSTRMPQTPQVPAPSSRHHERERESHDMSRHNTTASHRSRHSSNGHRSQTAHAPAEYQPKHYPEHYHQTQGAGPSRHTSNPHPQERPRNLSVLVEGSTMRIDMEITSETRVRDVVRKGYEVLGSPGENKHWHLCEAFGELHCERDTREYEQITSIIKGWDTLSTVNALVLRNTGRVVTANAGNVPASAPFVGVWVQYETKKGKWSKRWLETRGGQAFLCKNEKNKDELQINTLFFDSYIMTRAYPKSPHSHVFIMKRTDPAKNFENPDEYMHVFSADESAMFRITQAIFDAKSFTLANTYPHLLVPTSSGRNTRHDGSTSRSSRRPSGAENKPLIDLIPGKEKETGFTGKGLLKF